MIQRALILAGVVLPLTACLSDGFGIWIPTKTDRYEFPDNHIPDALLEEGDLTSGDGVQIARVLVRQEASTAAPTALFLHGQGGNIDDAWSQIQLLWDRGLNVLAIDYRGYGKSAGEPSEEGLYLDAVAGFAAAQADTRLDPARIVIWGFSLGTGVASYLALSAPSPLLVLEAPFTSMTDMVERSAPYSIPADWFTEIELDTLSRIDEIGRPLVVVHGKEDRRVPFWMGREVFERAAEPKRFVRVPDAGHNNLLEKALDQILEAMAAVAPIATP